MSAQRGFNRTHKRLWPEGREVLASRAPWVTREGYATYTTHHLDTGATGVISQLTFCGLQNYRAACEYKLLEASLGHRPSGSLSEDVIERQIEMCEAGLEKIDQMYGHGLAEVEKLRTEDMARRGLRWDPV